MTVQKPIRPDVLQGLLPGGQERERLYKLAATEAAHGLEGATYDNMVAGIVDTVLNRVASGDWGKNVRDVANAPNQFSAINGPRGRGYTVYGDVDAVPDSVVPAKLREAVDEHLDARLKGAPSIVGDAMNYANPNFSDAKNMGWINALDGPTFGSGNAVHVHGTVAGTQAVEAVLNASKEFINGVEAKESYYAALKGLLAPEKAEELQGFVNSATGAKAHGLQTGISYLMGKVKLTDGELTQAGVNMAAYREERGILPKEDRDRLSDQDVAKGIEDGKYIKDGDGNLVVLSQVKIGPESQKAMGALKAKLDGMKGTPEYAALVQQFEEEAAAARTAKQQRETNDRERMIAQDGQGGGFGGGGDIFDNMITMLIIGIVLQAVEQPQLAAQTVAPKAPTQAEMHDLGALPAPSFSRAQAPASGIQH